MTRFEGLEVRIRVGNTILPEYAPALNLRSRAGPESKYIQAVPGGNISVLITVLDDFKWYNAHGFHIRLDLGGFKCVCRFGEKEEPLAKAKTRSKEIDSGVCKNAASGYWERTHFRFGHPRQIPSNTEKQLASPGPAETMGKITVKVQRVIFKQALKEQIKEMRGTRLCAWPAKSLTHDQVGNPDNGTYVIQPAQIERVKEPEMDDTIARLISKRSNDLDFKMTFDFHYGSRPTNETEETILPNSPPSQIPPDLGVRIHNTLDPRLSLAGHRAWESEIEQRGWGHQVAEDNPRLSDIKDEVEADDVFIKQEYPFMTWSDAPEPSRDHDTYMSEEAELESCTVAEKEIHQSLERTASESNDGNETHDDNGDDEEELLDLEIKQRRLDKQLMIQKMELERDDIVDQLAARQRTKARKTSDTRRRGARSMQSSQASARMPTPVSTGPSESLTSGDGSRRGARNSGMEMGKAVIDLTDD